MTLMKKALVILPAWVLIYGAAWSEAGTSTLPPSKLPRVFEDARLGMSQHDMTAKLQHERNHVTSAARSTMVIQPKDRHLERIDYRFHHDALREIAIGYRADRLPGGYDGLLSRLRETYGEPTIKEQDQIDLRPDVLSTSKVVWRDDSTSMMLNAVRRLSDGGIREEIVLTLSDRALERAYEEEQARQYHRRVSRIPIPVSGGPQLKAQVLHGAANGP
jgi:hypothetical protein